MCPGRSTTRYSRRCFDGPNGVDGPTGLPHFPGGSAHAAHCAIEQGAFRLSYQELDRTIEQQVRHLDQTGLRAGERVALVAENRWQQVVGLWALLRRGNVACLISPRLPRRAAHQAARLVAATAWWEPTRLDRSLAEPCEGTEPGDPLAEHAGSLATILFSSGTTTLPKAVAHDLSAHLASAAGANQNLPLRTDDRWLLSLAWSHVSGLGILFRCALAGATAVIPAGRGPLADDLTQLAATHVSLVPTQLKRLLAERRGPPVALQACLLGGAPLPLGLVGQARQQGWPLCTTYGLTEMASQVTTTPPACGEAELRTAGRLLSGRRLITAADGEILVRGDTLFRGYCQPDGLHRPLDSDGWFHTGDRGRLDSRGYLTVVGRRDHMFISGGENIHPEEIERALLELEGILQAIVVPIADGQFGQRPVAFVEATDFQPAQWSAQLAEQLPRFKVPDHFLAWPASDDATGIKPSRRQLQTLASQQLKRG